MWPRAIRSAPWRRRSTKLRPSSRRRRPPSVPTTTRAAAIPRAPCWKSKSPRWKTARAASASPAEWPPSPASRGCCARATRLWPTATSTAEPAACSPACSIALASPRATPTPATSTSFAAQITERTRLVYLESPTNPLLRVVDIRQIAELAHANGAIARRGQQRHVAVPAEPARPRRRHRAALRYQVSLRTQRRHRRRGGRERRRTGETDLLPAERRGQCARSVRRVPVSARPEDPEAAPRLPAEERTGDRRVAGGASAGDGGQLSRAHDFSRLPLAAQAGARSGCSAQLHHRIGGSISRALSKPHRCSAFASASAASIPPSACRDACRTPAFRRKSASFATCPADLVRLSVGIEDAGDLIADLEQAFAASAIAPQEIAKTRTRRKWPEIDIPQCQTRAFCGIASSRPGWPLLAFHSGAESLPRSTRDSARALAATAWNPATSDIVVLERSGMNQAQSPYRVRTRI